MYSVRFPVGAGAPCAGTRWVTAKSGVVVRGVSHSVNAPRTPVGVPAPARASVRASVRPARTRVPARARPVSPRHAP